MRFWHPDPKVSVEFETLVDSIPYDSTLDITLIESRYSEIHRAFVNEWLRTEEDDLFQLHNEGIGGAPQQARAKTIYCQKCGGTSFHIGLLRDFLGTDEVAAKCVGCEFEITIGLSSLNERRGSDVADLVDYDIASGDDEIDHEIEYECINESAATQIETARYDDIPHPVSNNEVLATKHHLISSTITRFSDAISAIWMATVFLWHPRVEILLRKILWKIFPPPEVRSIVFEIRRFLNDNAQLCGYLVQTKCVRAARCAEKAVYYLRTEGKKPDELALTIIRNALADLLCSGHFHVYRGLLGIEGEDMLSLRRKTVRAMVDRGYYTELEAKADRQHLKEAIDSVG